MPEIERIVDCIKLIQTSIQTINEIYSVCFNMCGDCLK